jgi:GMP synthase (glutamine-hydrolysing)
MSVVVLDFGSQYSQLIVRRLRESNAFSVVLPGTASIDRVVAEEPSAIVLSGGPRCACDPDAPHPDERLYDLDLPILGICYGFHLLVERFGGRVVGTRTREYGRARLATVADPLSRWIVPESQVWMSHADSVERLPEGWTVVAATDENPIAGGASPDGRIVGVQFHPEVSHTPGGVRVLAGFLDSVGVRRDWTPSAILDRLATETSERVGEGRVLLAVSGGVDSSTLALLLARIGADHLGVFVDHGLLRAGERDEVAGAMASLGVNLRVEDATTRFLAALRGIEDPEAKRRTIGREFVRVFEDAAHAEGPFRFLAQGTLYPDVIESAGGEGANSPACSNFPRRFGRGTRFRVPAWRFASSARRRRRRSNWPAARIGSWSRSCARPGGTRRSGRRWPS